MIVICTSAHYCDLLKCPHRVPHEQRDGATPVGMSLWLVAQQHCEDKKCIYFEQTDCIPVKKHDQLVRKEKLTRIDKLQENDT